MQRCLELAIKGAGKVAPNPLVGAVLVKDDRIIAEGWHEYFGGPHAEVNCIDTVEDSLSIPNGIILYVSLEPCSHFGKTPPCTDLIIKRNIPKVVIGCRDPFKEVNGKGIGKLKAAGIEVEVGILEKDCKELNKRFFTFHSEHRPYVILKWAETSNGYVAPLAADKSRLFISNEYSNRLVHQWRSEEASILVGTNTAMLDDPELTTRLWTGNSPVRLVVDIELKLPHTLHLFNKQVKTIVFNKIKHEEEKNLVYYQVTEDVSLVHQMMNALYQMNIQSVIVEGGARLLQSFIDEGIWDEARVLVNGELAIVNGLPAPTLSNPVFISEQQLSKDTISYYKNNEAKS